MDLNGSQTSALTSALADNGVSGTVAQILAALDAANLSVADKESGVKVGYTDAVEATVRAVTGQAGLQVVTFDVDGTVLAIGRWLDPTVAGARPVMVPLAVVGAS